MESTTHQMKNEGTLFILLQPKHILHFDKSCITIKPAEPKHSDKQHELKKICTRGPPGVREI